MLSTQTRCLLLQWYPC